MTIQKLQISGIEVAAVYSGSVLITDTQSALDLIMTVKWETGCDRAAINKEAFADGFFILSTGLAGEILQKFINYQVKVAVYGDYSGYTSKPLKDFIYESNHGRDIFFTSTRDEALRMLAEASGGSGL